jgi:hypothetical protein
LRQDELGTRYEQDDGQEALDDRWLEALAPEI